MAINIPKEIKEQEHLTIILGLAILIVVFVLAVWPGFLKIEQEDRPKTLPVERFEDPEIDLEFLEDFNQTFKKVPPLRLYCPMEKTKGSLTSEEDCQAERDCFWDQDDESCQKKNYCPMEKTKGSPTSKEDCEVELACFWNQGKESCYKKNTNLFLSHLFLLY
jgi:hypothetical protein